MNPLRFLAIAAATMLILFCATWVLGPVAAGETIDWNVKTIATIRATTEPGAVAEILYINDDVNSAADNGVQTLTLGSLTVEVTFTWDAEGGSDRIMVTPPDGYMAVPDTLTLPEDGRGTLLIYPVTALGM